jgi:hypothetical protein
MRIEPQFIESKAIVGKNEDGNPIVYIVSKGGLHAFFSKNKEGEIISLGAAPHRGIAKYLAEKKDKDIKWDDNFNKGELTKSEDRLFEKFRQLVFAPVPEQPIENVDLHICYDSFNKTEHVISRSEVVDLIKGNKISPYAVVRPINLSKEPQIIKFSDDFGEQYE